MVDRYTKTVLTIIAVALVYIAAKDEPKPAVAQQISCGSYGVPCEVRLQNSANPLFVKITDTVTVRSER